MNLLKIITSFFFFTLILSIISISSPLLGEDMDLTMAQDTVTTESVGSLFQPAGFLQQHFSHNTNSDHPAAFSIYRARVGIAGKVTDRLSINIIAGAVEPPNRTPRLVNAFVDYKIDPRINIRTGQFLVPFGLEGPEVIIFNPLIERSLAVRRLNTFNMFRDVGIQAFGTTGLFQYAVALVNGSGANVAEQIDPKDIMGRIGITPMDHFVLGLSGHLGTYQPAGNSESEQKRFRAGTDFSFQYEHLLVRGEFILREDDLPDNNSLSQQGGYLLGAYHLTNNWQALLRFEFHDPNTSVDENELTSWTTGINYYIDGPTRVSANYEIRNDQMNPDLGDLFTVQFQVAI
ncbi:MAG: porin [Balneolales bacterium]